MLVGIQSAIFLCKASFTYLKYPGQLLGINLCLTLGWLCESVFLLYTAISNYFQLEYAELPDLLWHIITAANSIALTWILFRLKRMLVYVKREYDSPKVIKRELKRNS